MCSRKEFHYVMCFSVTGIGSSIKPSNAFEVNTVHLWLCPQTGQKQVTENNFFLHTSSIQAASCSILLIVFLFSTETDVELIKIKC